MGNFYPHSEQTKLVISQKCIGTKITNPNRSDAERLRDRLKMRKFRAKNPDRVKFINKRWRDKNKEKIREYNLRNRLGVTKEQWNKAFEYQKGLCSICLSEKYLVTDHCHKTGKFRGLLCIRCNTSLGVLEWFRNNQEIFSRTMKYLSEEKLWQL